MNTNELPPPPDLRKIIPDGWERVKIGEMRQPGDLFLDGDIWLRVDKFSQHKVVSQLVIRRKPRPKKVRPLNAAEWPSVAHCAAAGAWQGCYFVPRYYSAAAAEWYASVKEMCHPPGFPNDIRKLYVEEDAE